MKNKGGKGYEVRPEERVGTRSCRAFQTMGIHFYASVQVVCTQHYLLL